MQKRSSLFPSLTRQNAKVLAQDTIDLAQQLGYKLKKKKLKNARPSQR